MGRSHSPATTARAGRPGPRRIAVQAALEATGGGTVGGVERDGESGGVWEVEVHKPDGSVVDVHLDAQYQLLVIDGDNETADTNDASS